jgi:hypothetical protein
LDVFFAVLPLPVLWWCWPSSGSHEPLKFVDIPEVAMTSCVLYGLTISRYLQGILGDTAPGKRSGVVAASVVLIPLSGVILSIVLVCKLSFGQFGCFIQILQILNLLSAILSMFLLGGYGESRSS